MGGESLPRASRVPPSVGPGYPCASVRDRRWTPATSTSRPDHHDHDHPIRTKRTGQRGPLWLSFEPKEDSTVLAGRYTSSPFGTVRANYPDGSGIPEIQIINPSGGILGGDSLELEISLAPGSPATILTQAANKAYRGASSEHRALSHVGEGAFIRSEE